MACGVIIPLLFLLIIIAIFGGIAGGLLFYISRLKKRMRAIGDTPLSKVGELREGLGKVRGQVLALDEPLISPLSKEPCLYYRFKVEEQRTRTVYHGSRRGSHTQTYWHTVVDDKQAIRCALEDQTGRADVKLLAAEMILDTSGHARSGFLRDASPELKEMLWEEYGYSTKGLLFNKTVRYSEQIIQDGDVLFVLGDVEMRKGRPPLFHKGDNPFIISDRNEAGVLTHYKRKITWCYVGLAAAAIFGVIFSIIPIIFLLIFVAAGAVSSQLPTPNQNPPVVKPNPPAAPQPDPIDTALLDFQSPDRFVRSRAADRLTHMPPEEKRRAEVVAALKRLAQDPDVFPREAAKRALKVWDTDAANRGGVPNPQPQPQPQPQPPPRPDRDKPNPPPPPPQPKREPGRAEVPWNVQPDPVALERVALDLKATLPTVFMGLTVYSTSPQSPMVAMQPPGITDKSQVQVYDLRQMKPVGQAIRGSFGGFGQKFALSPDGAYFATLIPKAPKAMIVVYSSAAGGPLRKIDVDDDPQMKVSMFDFVWDNHLITLKHKGEFVDFEVPCVYQVWDLKTGKEVTQFDYDLRFIPRWGTFTPGRRYLVMEHTRGQGDFHIVFWDLKTGKQAGDLVFQGKDEKWGQSAGIAFTPDGEKLAMLWRLADANKRWFRVFCFDVKTGKKLRDFNLTAPSARGEFPWTGGGTGCLQWVPDGSGMLLFGHLLVDYESGAVVWKLGEEPKASQQIVERRFFDRDHLTTLEGTNFKRSLAILTLPRAEIDAATKKAREAAAGDK